MNEVMTLTSNQQNRPVLVRFDQVQFFAPSVAPKGMTCIFFAGDGDMILVKESFDQVREMIKPFCTIYTCEKPMGEQEADPENLSTELPPGLDRSFSDEENISLDKFGSKD
jgi:hypothetical protein